MAGLGSDRIAATCSSVAAAHSSSMKISGVVIAVDRSSTRASRAPFTGSAVSPANFRCA
ncbi:unannotated protein [freshwater metagenome]|uniref:Unannotated protein n=1 Tax=freshwater metagenome TaxID=449393 RepID=A0A6J7EU98_9ZZZZ